MDGNVREEEVLNQSQIFITTAGYKNTYSYEKLIQLLVRMTTKGDALVMGSLKPNSKTASLASATL